MTGGLAELLGGVGDVEDVVDDLEHHAEGVAPLGQVVDDLPLESGDDPPTRAAVPNSDVGLPRIETR